MPSSRSEWAQTIQAEEMKRQKRRWRIEITEHDRWMIVMKLERLAPNEVTAAEKHLLEFLRSLDRKGDGKTLIKKPPRKGRPIRTGSESKRKTAAQAVKSKSVRDKQKRAVEIKAKNDERKVEEKAAKRKRSSAAKKTAATSAKKNGSDPAKTKKRRSSWSDSIKAASNKKGK